MRGKLYIAYGSNLNLEQMQYRCPTAKFVGTGILENYELQFKGSLHNAHATIAPKPGAAVPGVIWEIQSADELRLDYYEGYPSYYFKQELDIPMGDKTIRGMAYLMDQRMGFGNPSQHYYDTLFQGYLDCGLDVEILNRAVDDSMNQAQRRMEPGGMELC